MIRNLFEHEKSRRILFILLVCGMSLLAVAVRLDGFSGLPGKLLWAEDGHVFLKSAMEHRLASVVMPSAGYLHVYARIVACIASLFGPHLIPYIMLCGWLLGYMAAAIFVVHAMRLYGIRPFVALSVVLICAFTPTSGETLFTITNVQWHLGAALAVVVLMPTARVPSFAEIVFVAMTSLTGPFSIILLPVIALRCILFRDAYARQKVDVVVIVCALVQFSFFVGSDRLGAQTSKDLSAWGQAILRLMTFGVETKLSIFAASIFWCIYFFLMFGRLMVAGVGDRAFRGALLFLVASCCFMLAGLYAVRQDPSIVSAVGGGARYFIIPYFLVVVSAVVICGQRLIPGFLLLVPLLIVDWQGFRVIDRFDYGYENYVDFASVRSGVFIPINPRIDDYQFGYRTGNVDSAKLLMAPRKLEPDKIVPNGAGRWSLNWSKIGCASDTHTLGLELYMNVPKRTVLHAGWNDYGSAAGARQRYVLDAGLNNAYLALPWKQGGVVNLAVEALGGGSADAHIYELRVFCISKVE